MSDCGKRIIIRIPLIPSFNDNEDEFRLIGGLLRPLKVENVEVLPYHKMGEHK